MPGPFVDRRRSPRATVAAGQEAILPMSTTVQVMDISLSGVLLSSPVGVEVGRQAHLRTVLGSDVFEAQVVIRRAAPEQGPQSRIRLGGEFVMLDENNRQTIERFLPRRRALIGD